MPISKRSSSQSIVARNRANAQHSTGPRTAAGKAAASRNAVKHGLLGTQALALPGEDQAAMDAHRDDYVAKLGASGIVQIDFAERAAYLVWRLSRLARYKRGLLTPPDPNGVTQSLDTTLAPRCPNAAMATQCPNAATAKRNQVDEDPQCQALDRAALQADLDDATYTLERLQCWGRLPADQPLAARCATALLSLYASTLDPWEEVLPLLPDAQPGQSPADYCAAPLRTAAEWRTIYKDLALRSGVTWEAMSWAAMETASDEVRRLTALLAPPPPPLPPPPPPQPPAPALLPDLDTLERLTRYETCLARELSRALRELRQLQAAERAIECQTNPTAHPQPAAAGVAAAIRPRPEAYASMSLPHLNTQTNPAAPHLQPAAAARPCHDTAVSGPSAAAPGPDHQIAETNPTPAPAQPAAAVVVAAIRPQPEALQAAAVVVAAIRPQPEALQAAAGVATAIRTHSEAQRTHRRRIKSTAKRRR